MCVFLQYEVAPRENKKKTSIPRKVGLAKHWYSVVIAKPNIFLQRYKMSLLLCYNNDGKYFSPYSSFSNACATKKKEILHTMKSETFVEIYISSLLINCNSIFFLRESVLSVFVKIESNS